MDTSWSIVSGGRLKKNQISENTSFTIKTDDRVDSILLKTSEIKQSFEEALTRQFTTGKAQFSTQPTFCIQYSSAVRPRESAWRDIELSVIVKDCAYGDMLWYFILFSPEAHISPGNLGEIASLVADRLLLKKSGI